MIKIINVIASIIVVQNIFANDFVKIKPVYKEDNHLYIRDKKDYNKKLLKFKIKIKEKSLQKQNGNIIFNIRLKNIEKIDDAITLENIVFENNNQISKIKRSNSGVNRTDDLQITIPRDYISNAPFGCRLQNQFKVKINDKYQDVDPILLEVIPVLSISFDNPEEAKANLGKITYADGVVKSEKKHEFHLNYNCLSNANLNVESKNNFRLKHKKEDEYIPFVLKLGDKKIMENGNIELVANDDDFKNSIDCKCKVKANMPAMPLAGKYYDTVTFTITPSY